MEIANHSLNVLSLSVYRCFGVIRNHFLKFYARRFISWIYHIYSPSVSLFREAK